MPEKQNVEWKAIWKDEYLQWICGFANAQGGTLYIGKDDDGNPVGLQNAKKLLEDLPNTGNVMTYTKLLLILFITLIT